MENNFLTDAELPATVSDIKSLYNKVSSLIPTANNIFSNARLLLVKGLESYTSVSFEGSIKKHRIINYQNTLIFDVQDNNDQNGLQLMSINQEGVISKIGGGSFSALSDERMKDNIQAFEDGLNKVLSINPKSFQYKAVEGTPTENYPDFICEKTQYGVIAQELETVAPEMVTTGEDGFKSVDLSNLCLLLVNAVKEQNQMIINLTARVEALENPTPQA